MAKRKADNNIDVTPRPEPTEAMVEAAAYPIFVGVAKAPWTSREDDELCPVEPFSKNHARNLAKASLRAAIAVSPGCRGAELAEAARLANAVGYYLHILKNGASVTLEQRQQAVDRMDAALDAFRASGETGPDQ